MAISWIWKFLHVFSTIVWSAFTSGCWLGFLCCWCWCCLWFSRRSWSCGSNEQSPQMGAVPLHIGFSGSYVS